MLYKDILITGGAGFVGSNLAVMLKQSYSDINITALDNLSRKGSELNLPRLKKNGITFKWGDIRNEKDLEIKTDLIIECAAEPSVMAGVDSSPSYLINTNLIGLINSLEIARKNEADIIFLSSSRVYPHKDLNTLLYRNSKSRFEWREQDRLGFSLKGINEKFPLGDIRTMYGTTKLASELFINEYIENYKIKGVINRCGLISGPWQMGKVDQGVIMLWLAAHYYKKKLSYIGFEGSGKQVRDVLHINDLFELIKYQINHLSALSGMSFNVGGGEENSVSLLELTEYCQNITGNKVIIDKKISTRAGDVRIYITDNSKITSITKWKPSSTIQQTLIDIYEWLKKNEEIVYNALYS